MKSLINVIFTPGSNIPNFDNIICIEKTIYGNNINENSLSIDN